ncbi:MAG: hypothetical protein ACK55Z_10925, partial [bacterium]
MAENQEATPLHQDNLQQGALNDLKRARLSRGGKYDLAPRQPPPHLDRRYIGRLRKRDKLLMGAEG